ncbi:glycosyltransferase family 4 protein [Thauera aromatica]|uniref:Glycosyltransferase n=1 Tax=Thauera aromatica K172 TaxID=44139 RepID=A0A2R4BKN0_THAAR|nr:glycosyltransferase family 4 protein [Thauera aromatica]AVR87885.1 Glycosyltransferase [Thauera aromatica K172]
MNAPRRPAVHQFTPGIDAGDGVSNGIFFTRALLREMGFDSEIFAFTIPEALKGEVHFPTGCADDADQVLLVHHALGHDFGDWIDQRKARKVLVYHNITPASFFPAEHPVHALSLRGRDMLRRWQAAGRFVACIGDSDYNSGELRGLGFTAVRTIPLLVDVDACRARPWDAGVVQNHADRFTLLFVGRLSPHKCQHRLLEVMAALLPRLAQPAELLLVGGSASAEYEAQLRDAIRRLALEGYVHLMGKVDEATLYGLYRAADIFVCLSEHEGFGMPLIEAMLFDLPVIAADFASVADTMGCGGLVMQECAPEQVAATIACVAADPALRAALIAGQQERVERFERARLVADLHACLGDLGVGTGAERLSRTVTGAAS